MKTPIRARIAASAAATTTAIGGLVGVSPQAAAAEPFLFLHPERPVAGTMIGEGYVVEVHGC